MPGEQERDADDETEERELLGHVARVESGRQRRLGDPDVPGRVVDGPAVGLQRLGGVVGALSVSGREPRHLRVRHATRGLERVDPHVARERTGAIAGVDRLAGDVAPSAA